MAKKQIKNYVFIPGAAGVGKVKVLDKIVVGIFLATDCWIAPGHDYR